MSVCIPAYRRTHYLKRLLQSLAQQTFRDFEVILSDDSNDAAVQQLAAGYKRQFPLLYIANETPFGTPANWNVAIGKASGEWIKLMHDDDWFATPDALQHFADATRHGQQLIFSAYTNVFEEKNSSQTVRLPSFFAKRIGQNPSLLMAKNVIGPPSVTLVHRSVAETYDERMKWRVDTDFYERILRQQKEYQYIDRPLIKVGISASQVTQSCLYLPEVELPEGLMLLQKFGVSPLKHILVYDAWWRLLRNMNITTEQQLQAHTTDEWPPIIINMVNDLRKLPRKALTIGFLSKILMTVSYLRNRKKI